MKTKGLTALRTKGRTALKKREEAHRPKDEKRLPHRGEGRGSRTEEKEEAHRTGRGGGGSPHREAIPHVLPGPLPPIHPPCTPSLPAPPGYTCPSLRATYCQCGTGRRAVSVRQGPGLYRQKHHGWERLCAGLSQDPQGRAKTLRRVVCSGSGERMKDWIARG